MLDDRDDRFLRAALRNGPLLSVEAGAFLFAGNFEAAPLHCHRTAMQVAVEAGFPPVVGIQFIDLNDKLYPWPHMVNRQRDGTLVDYSPKPDQPLLAFVPTGWGSLDAWRRIVTAYDALGNRADAASWGDPVADGLTRDFLAPLRAGRGTLSSRLEPDSPLAQLVA